MTKTSASPYAVPSYLRRVDFVVAGSSEVPPAVTAKMTACPFRRILRLAGGCSGMSPEDSAKMLKYMEAGLSAFRGVASSGGTRSVSDGQVNPMITEVPGLLVCNNPAGVLAISTIPRTGGLGLVEDSRLILDDRGGAPNPGVHMLVLVQSINGSPLPWDGDLEFYFDAFGNLIQYASWKAGMVAYNGGGVTEREIRQAARQGWPVILVQNSGRATDKIIAELKAGVFADDAGSRHDSSNFYIVPNGDVGALREAVRAAGLII